jgi:MFS family permease
LPVTDSSGRGPSKIGSGVRRASRPNTPRVLFVAAGLETMAYGTVYALLADLQDRYGLPTWGLGLIAGATFAGAFVAQLTLARFADRGHARRLIRVGLLVAAAAIAWFGLSSELWQFVTARLLIGLGSGAFLPAAQRMIVFREPDRAGELLGRMASVQVAGFVLGPPVAAILSETIGLRAPFLVQAAALLACAPALARLEEPQLAESAERRPLRLLLRRRGVWIALCIGVGTQLSVGSFEAVWARFLTDKGATTALIAITLSVFPLPMVFGAGYAGRLSDRHGAVRIGAIGLTGLSITSVLTGVVDPLWGLCVVSVLAALANTLVLPAGPAAMTTAATSVMLAAGQGLYSAVGNAVAALASVAAAAIYEAWGATATWVSAGAVTLALVGIAVSASAHTPTPAPGST